MQSRTAQPRAVVLLRDVTALERALPPLDQDGLWLASFANALAQVRAAQADLSEARPSADASLTMLRSRRPTTVVPSGSDGTSARVKSRRRGNGPLCACTPCALVLILLQPCLRGAVAGARSARRSQRPDQHRRVLGAVSNHQRRYDKAARTQLTSTELASLETEIRDAHDAALARRHNAEAEAQCPSCS